ncbi:ArnT family glycosyltransferase [Sphingomonas nostoxanthinifaciens]|uniref:ArnT family glycosyltransferase n=1 Tax=Sphingomonas nostoxanthinifaciens TaxID=2872652 RepID=UPI001CC1DC85|nr:hypothetical protein [Sphingomonas nostoxanthinifaciens]UAK24450.1 hypothetical protein K8P63_19425 [Sphingomonas nostoxanthinifaciens]
MPRTVDRNSWLDLSGRGWTLALILLVVATFLIRARYYGNPFIDVDEQFYLLTGDRMLHGAVPYIDIWDRKPVGLFLLYAAIRLLGGDGIIQYQLVASGFAAATAVMIAVMARRIAPPGAALVAALAYIPALAMNGGAGGQTPVFYNLPMVVAAWLILNLAARPASLARIRLHGVAAMLLVGIAMQIKYSAVFEGVYFGLTLMWLSWRCAPRRVELLLDAALWAGVALLPTVAALAYYAGIGEMQAFLYANFSSIAARGAVSPDHESKDLRHIVVRMLPFTLPIILGEWLLRDHGAFWRRRFDGTAAHAFLIGWLVAAIIGFAAFGTFFNHYALPLLVPLAIVAAPTFAIRYRRAGAVMGTISLLGLFIPYPLNAAKDERRHGGADYAAMMTAQIAPNLHGRCLYVFYGEPILYQLTHSCLPSRWAFPFHLSLAREAPALGVDPVAEARRIMASKPPVVVDRITTDDEINPVVQHLVRADLARNYRLAWSYRRPDPSMDVDRIWVRRPQS